jgi:hypothetical protein
MKDFVKNIVLFFLFAMIIGEIVVRITHSVSDIPQRTIDEFGIQKYHPNQDGYWKGGNHKWTINSLGWSGKLPQSYDNLVTVIGDSYIENFMNPIECHQSIFLKENLKNYNFFAAGRSGVSLIEAMEISKQLDTLMPAHTLIYVNDNDFHESIYEIDPLNDITQLKIDDYTIVYGQMKRPGLKKILYSWKLLYYFYNRFPLSNIIKTESKKNHLAIDSKYRADLRNQKVMKLISYITNNYSVKNKTLVFHPNSSSKIIEICKNAGFNSIILDSSNDNKDWTFGYDNHWTCYGHKKAAEQVSSSLLSEKTLKISSGNSI